MQIEQKYIVKYFHRIATDQIADQYIARGYNVRKEASIGSFRADLLAEKNDEKIIIEVKTHKLRSESKKRLTEIADYVNSLGQYKFVVAIALPPKEKKIEFSEIETLLTEEFTSNLPDELDTLSTHTTISSVRDIVISSVAIREDSIECVGSGIVDVDLQYGSDGDQTRGDGFETHESFSFEFDALFEIKNNRMSFDCFEKLDFDTSEF